MPDTPFVWYWDERTRRYHDDVSKRFLSFATVESLMETYLEEVVGEVDALSERAAAGTIDVGEWEEAMIDAVRRAYEANCSLARGGVEQITDDDRQMIDEMLKFQYERLNRFAGQLAEGHWTATGGAIGRRALMYINSARNAFWTIITENEIAVGSRWERWVPVGEIGDDNTCEDCLALAAKGWVKLGTLPQPASGTTRCLSNCRCTKKFSKAAKKPSMRADLEHVARGILLERIGQRMGLSWKRQENQRGGPGSGYHTPHAGRPGEIGGSQPREGSGMVDEQARRRSMVGRTIHDLREVEKLIAGLDHEEAYFVDADGTVSLWKVGDEGSVAFTPEDVKEAWGAIMTHDHPSHGGTFSGDDVRFAIVNRLRGVNAVSLQGDKVIRFSLRPGARRPAGDWGIDRDMFEMLFQENKAVLAPPYIEQVKAGAIGNTEANLEFMDAMWTRMSADLGWAYRREVFTADEFMRACPRLALAALLVRVALSRKLQGKLGDPYARTA